MQRIVIIAENIRSIYNVGSFIRSAEVFQAEVFCTGFTPYGEALKKTSIGAEEVVPWKYFYDTASAIDFCKDQGMQVFALETGGEYIHQMNPVHEDIALILGNEIQGVSAETLALCDGCISLEQFGTVKESLNVSVACGIALGFIRYSWQRPAH